MLTAEIVWEWEQGWPNWKKRKRAKKAFLVGGFLMSQCRGRGEEIELRNGRNKKRGKTKGGGKNKSQKQRTSKEKWNGVKLVGTNAWSSQDFLWSYLISLSVLPLLLGQTSRMLSGQDGKTGDFRGFFFPPLPLSSQHLTSWHTLFFSMSE